MKFVVVWITALFAMSVFFGAAAMADEMEGGIFSSSRAGEYIGKNVRSEEGGALGYVKDLVFGEDGRVSYLILSRGGFLGMGERLVPIPLGITDIHVDQGTLVVDISREKLEKAPHFAEGQWPSFSDTNWERMVHGYYEERQVEGAAGGVVKTAPVEEAVEPESIPTEESDIY